MQHQCLYNPSGDPCAMPAAVSQKGHFVRFGMFWSELEAPRVAVLQWVDKPFVFFSKMLCTNSFWLSVLVTLMQSWLLSCNRGSPGDVGSVLERLQSKHAYNLQSVDF